jgi:hypothetical protein
MLMCDLFELYQEYDMLFATFIKLQDLFTFSTLLILVVMILHYWKSFKSQ